MNVDPRANILRTMSERIQFSTWHGSQWNRFPPQFAAALGEAYMYLQAPASMPALPAPTQRTLHARTIGDYCTMRSAAFARYCAVLGVAFAMALSAPLAGAAKTQAVPGVSDEDCGTLAREGGYGPWDYTNPDTRQPAEVKIVESYHFTPKVEALISGESALLGGDIGYTLNVWPNHHRALMSMANLAIREKKSKPAGARYSVECYFERARRMNPNDGMVDLVYAIYESRLGKWRDALTDAKKAEQQLPESKDVHYNLGLIYFNLKDYPNAREHAKKAYALGHQLPGLRQKLQAAKAWDE